MFLQQETSLIFKEVDFKIKENTYIDALGREVPYNNWKSTDFIPIGSEDTLLINNIGNYNAWYDSEKIFISRLMIQNYKAVTPTIPKNAKYLRLSCENNKEIKVYKLKE